VAKLADALDL